ncbi:Quinol monooxygenase YgiN [Sphingomonas sp. YR710]|jgi:quinol monooxygenase YgiN|uniref:putative quinol monooxygenase n=1 Tax=Sphingomonas sp. YR710 TaxID=1882773 RepID=UPI00088CE78D|nr:antibiotic biosynthesis monooxygenase [Sphingomonas sp. YR710]SDC05215.1 Quinol monooxygenase YgiN [Sphingomonas sp. YR710]
MTVVRHYLLHAIEGHDAALETVLSEITDFFRAQPGALGLDLLRDCGNERRFLLIERWETIEAHGAAAQLLPQPLIKRLIAALDGPPEGTYFDYLKQV